MRCSPQRRYSDLTPYCLLLLVNVKRGLSSSWQTRFYNASAIPALGVGLGYLRRCNGMDWYMTRWSQGKILCRHNLILQSYTYLSSSICIWSKDVKCCAQISIHRTRSRRRKSFGILNSTFVQAWSAWCRNRQPLEVLTRSWVASARVPVSNPWQNPSFYYRGPRHAIKSTNVASDPLTNDPSSSSIRGCSAFDRMLKQKGSD